MSWCYYKSNFDLCKLRVLGTLRGLQAEMNVLLYKKNIVGDQKQSRVKTSEGMM